MTDRPLILPPLRRTAKDAEAFAWAVHGGQTDKAGRAYVFHLSNVAVGAWRSMVDGCGFDTLGFESDQVRQIGWLHDVIEDTPYMADDLLNEGFHRNVVDAVKLLSKPPGCLRYLDWIGHIAELGTLPTILVKIADIEDNSDPDRLALLDEPTQERLKAKYGAALPILKEAAARMGWRQGHE